LEKPPKQIVLDSPPLSDAFNAIKTGISHRKIVVTAGTCTVEYEGRANSLLSQGERLAIFKPDGSALVHRPKEYSPVNWQPPGSIFQTKLGEKELIVRVYRQKDHEVMEVAFTSLKMVSILDLKDSGEFTLYASESDMQQAILAQPSLLEEGFRPITKEKTVDPGFIDILGVDKENVLTVVELKRVKATKKAVLQLKKYMDVIDLDSNRKVRAILVAPSLAEGAQEVLTSLGYEFKALSPQQCAEVLKQKAGRSITDFFK
jgi:RecB family endonuclease NucS